MLNKHTPILQSISFLLKYVPKIISHKRVVCEIFITALFISSVQSLTCVRIFAAPWTPACQASLSITNSQSPPKITFIESVSWRAGGTLLSFQQSTNMTKLALKDWGYGKTRDNSRHCDKIRTRYWRI